MECQLRLHADAAALELVKKQGQSVSSTFLLLLSLISVCAETMKLTACALVLLALWGVGAQEGPTLTPSAEQYGARQPGCVHQLCFWQRSHRQAGPGMIL